MRSLALFWSGFFHPVFVPVYVVMLAFWLQPVELMYYGPRLTGLIVLEVIIIASLVPMLAMAVLIKLGLLQSVMAENRHERHWPYLIQALCLASLVFLFRSMNLAHLLYMGVTGALLAVLGAWFINRHWKISAHSIGMGGLAAFVWCMQGVAQQAIFWPLLLSFIFAGLVGSSRLYLQAHQPAQIYAGYLLGSGSMLLALLPYWLKL